MGLVSAVQCTTFYQRDRHELYVSTPPYIRPSNVTFHARGHISGKACGILIPSVDNIHDVIEIFLALFPSFLVCPTKRQIGMFWTLAGFFLVRHYKMQRGFSGCLEINNESVGSASDGWQDVMQKMAEINVPRCGCCQFNNLRMDVNTLTL